MAYFSISEELRAGGFEQVTVGAAAVGLTASQIKPASGIFNGKHAFSVTISVETDQVRFRVDGTDPTSTVGDLLNSGDRLTINGTKNIQNFKAIRVTTNAQLNVTYWFTPAGI